MSEKTEHKETHEEMNEQVEDQQVSTENETEASDSQNTNVEEEQKTIDESKESTQENSEELTVEACKAKIAELEAKLAQEEERFLRLRADYDNLRRRSQLDLQSAEKYRAQSLLTDLLPVIDNFERALSVKVTSDDATSLYKGIEMIYNSLIAATEKEGLEVIPAVGEPFDPNIHQAVMQESDAEKESGIVLKELQKGYKLKDRVIRPSMVSVNE